VAEYEQQDLFSGPPDQWGDCPHCGRPMGDLDAGGTTGRTHPETSRRAAETKVTYGHDRHAVMRELHRRGQANASHIAEAVGVSPNQTAARLLELRSAGYVRRVRDDDGKFVTLPTVSGSTGIAQTLTPAGRALLAELEATPPSTSST